MSETTSPPIRDAATLIVLRQDRGNPEILMGQRGAGAVFMPNKFVFPGGRVDETDSAVVVNPALPETCRVRLEADTAPGAANALAAAAIRELWEETGLILGRPTLPEDIAAPVAGWQNFHAAGFRPAADAMRFVFRAITPAGRPRRFDARFFMVPATALQGDPDDFSRADDELSHLSWLSLAQARDLDLPFITEIVLSELEARLAAAEPDARPIPFFDNRDAISRFHML